MHSSIYYDTCIFENSQNTTHPESKFCNDALDPVNIKWRINLSELSYAEANIEEFLNAFIDSCNFSGIDIQLITTEQVRSTKKQYNKEKKRYTQLGLSTKDWGHLISSVYSRSTALLSTDEDFWDPSNKSRSGAHFLKNAPIKRQIIADFSIEPLLPSEL